MLKVLDDRVIQVVGMGTDAPSNSHPEVGQPDIQVALMKTEKGTVLRMAVGFAMRGPTKDDHHWYQLMGTHGRVEWRRRPSDNPRMWQAKGDHEEMMDMNWKMEDPAAPDAAKGSGAIKIMAAFDLYLHLPRHIVASTVRERTFESFGLSNGRGPR